MQIIAGTAITRDIPDTKSNVKSYFNTLPKANAKSKTGSILMKLFISEIYFITLKLRKICLQEFYKNFNNGNI